MSALPHPVLALLKGGPDEIPRVLEMSPDWSGEQVKIPLWSGYEHFEFSQEYVDIGGGLMPVYRWAYRTAIAE
ncbi:DUF5988 family protein [Saccharothrix sp. ST-888]|uniref:DUF5988 family protein n=1 Tax=Saccharothrix sp. ST-888 TaxID=1427391 RepID=UPI0012E01836|nr:DUF5988 family protein [Saccharothrix sp. ST-888]